MQLYKIQSSRDKRHDTLTVKNAGAAAHKYKIIIYPGTLKASFFKYNNIWGNHVSLMPKRQLRHNIRSTELIQIFPRVTVTIAREGLPLARATCDFLNSVSARRS